jgi:nicotinamidase-related amidase
MDAPSSRPCATPKFTASDANTDAGVRLVVELRIPVDLASLVAPDRSALLTVEVQHGVVGAGSVLPELAEAAAPVLPNIAALAKAARATGIPVMHCVADSRPDGLGGNRNARLFGAMRKHAGSGGPSAPSIAPTGSSSGLVHAAIEPDERDLVMARLHGVSPMTATSVDPVLRNLGVTTIVATGVSVNVAVLGLAFEAVNLGYQVVVPHDAVAGVDAAYVEAVFQNTLSLLATVTTTAALLQLWGELTAL